MTAKGGGTASWLLLAVATSCAPPASPTVSSAEKTEVVEIVKPATTTPPSAPPPPGLVRFVVATQYLPMAECGLDVQFRHPGGDRGAGGEALPLSCAYGSGGNPTPTHSPQRLRAVLTDPPGWQLVASEVPLESMLLEADVVLAECEYTNAGEVKDVWLGAIKNVPGFLHATQVQVGVMHDCSVEPFELPDTLAVAHILKSHVDASRAPAGTKRSREDAAALAAKVHALLASGTLSFAEAAKVHSDEKASGKRGGALGKLKRGRMDPGFEFVLLSTPPASSGGQRSHSYTFETVFGFHVLERM